MILRPPGGPRGVVVQERVSLIDLAPTILTLLQFPVLEQFQGEPLLDDHFNPQGGEREVFSELPTFGLRSLIDRDKKIMLKPGGWEFFDLANDAGERNNLTPSGFVDLRKRLDQHVAGNQVLAEALAGVEKEEVLNEETLEQMKALGYIK